MPDGEVSLVPARALAGARDLASSGRQINTLRDIAGGRIAAASAGQPWGKDEAGAAFERSYRGLERETFAAWERLATYLEGLGHAAAQAVDNTLAADGEAGVRVRGTRKSA